MSFTVTTDSSKLNGVALDWMVSTIHKPESVASISTWLNEHASGAHRYSSDFNTGMPILVAQNATWDGQSATICKFRDGHYPKWSEYGSNFLEAGLRAYVASSVGPKVTIPAILVHD